MWRTDMKYLMLAVFAVSGAVHLYGSYRKDRKLRRMSKAFIVISLLGWYLTASPEPKTVTALALFFSWLGDVLLMPDGTGWFVAGGIAFMASHVLFIFSYLPFVDFGKTGFVPVVLAAAVYAAAVLLVFRGLRDRLPEKIGPAMMAYLFINGAMNCFAFWLFLSLGWKAAVTFAGAVLFFVSDSLLFYVRSDKSGQRSHFGVMLTYILAEFLIVLGLLQING